MTSSTLPPFGAAPPGLGLGPVPGLGLYLHIPFCQKICHYCDFAKTARYSAEQVTAYLANLTGQWQAVARHLPKGLAVDSVFLGGGTPSLFTAELSPLMKAISAKLSCDAELTIEVNPLHATPKNLSIWRQQGFNRISLGVQSFADAELSLLTRLHRRQEALAAVANARQQFSNVSVDLIYGLPNQTEQDWQHSIRTAIAAGAEHLSMYTLTYEGNTVFNRRKNRQMMAERSDDTLASFYELACKAAQGYEHYEVSNWAKPGKRCRHNQKYWQMADYLALGTGAHGFLAALDQGPKSAGLRYSFSRKIGQNQSPAPKASGSLAPGASGSLAAELAALGASFEPGRTSKDYLEEAVLSSVRTANGVPIAALEQRLGLSFGETAAIRQALACGAAQRQRGRLVFAPWEWYREYGWVHEVLAGFSEPEAKG